MIRPNSQPRAIQDPSARADWADKHGIPFSEYRNHLPQGWRNRCPDLVLDGDAYEYMHYTFDFCFLCGVLRRKCGKLDCHHLTGGTKGRSDERCVLVMACRPCHVQQVTNAHYMGRGMYAKWKFDQAGTDWVRLATLHRKFLYDLIPHEIDA